MKTIKIEHAPLINKDHVILLSKIYVPKSFVYFMGILPHGSN